MSEFDDNKKNSLNEFTKFVIETLKIETPPKIIVKNNREGLVTTANYDYTKDDKIIMITRKGRALVDVMRSVAHELVHHKQWEDGKLKVKPPDIGHKIENEANAIAGILIKLYSKKDSSIYDE